MIKWSFCLLLALALSAANFAEAHATELHIWVRAFSAPPLEKLADLYNASHP